MAAASVTLPWIAAKEIDTASAGWAANPASAFHRLDVARRLNPLTDEADVVAGVIEFFQYRGEVSLRQKILCGPGCQP